ncbi:MAG: hypothetical protein JO142_04990 [Burkholderiales bacterium]|nr:hypothetical protein [Burkholderiales bacterium]
MISSWKRRGNHLTTAKLAVRRHLPWYVRGLLVLALVGLMVGALMAAYNYGERQGRYDPSAVLAVEGASREMQKLARELADERQRSATGEQQLRVESTTRDALSHQVQQLQQENSGYRDQIAFYESLLTQTERAPALSIEGLKAESTAAGRYRVRALLVQGQSSQTPFKGRVDFRLVVERAGKRSELTWPQAAEPLLVSRFARVERDLELAADTHLREIEIRIYDQSDNRVHLSRTYDVKG